VKKFLNLVLSISKKGIIDIEIINDIIQKYRDIGEVSNILLKKGMYTIAIVAIIDIILAYIRYGFSFSGNL